jgi:regulator of protease activity HflC (stomatin/prohibitin superfamily)
MPSFVELAVFLVLLAVSVGVAILVGQPNAGLGVFVAVVGAIVAALVAASIKVANQWERGLVLRLGEFR